MTRAPRVDDQPVGQAQTRRTGDLVDARLQDVLVVDGPFGWSGVYPLNLPETQVDGLCVRHCNLYYLVFAMPPHVREKAAVVVEKTHYRLADGAEVVTDMDLCLRCRNKECPPNRNPLADAVDFAAGKLILALN